MLHSMEENPLLTQNKKRLSTSTQKRERKRRKNQQKQLLIAATCSPKMRSDYLNTSRSHKEINPATERFDLSAPLLEEATSTTMETIGEPTTDSANTAQGDDAQQIPTWSTWLVSWVWSNNKK